MEDNSKSCQNASQFPCRELHITQGGNDTGCLDSTSPQACWRWHLQLHGDSCLNLSKVTFTVTIWVHLSPSWESLNTEVPGLYADGGRVAQTWELCWTIKTNMLCVAWYSLLPGKHVRQKVPLFRSLWMTDEAQLLTGLVPPPWQRRPLTANRWQPWGCFFGSMWRIQDKMHRLSHCASSLGCICLMLWTWEPNKSSHDKADVLDGFQPWTKSQI